VHDLLVNVLHCVCKNKKNMKELSWYFIVKSSSNLQLSQIKFRVIMADTLLKSKIDEYQDAQKSKLVDRIANLSIV
jgi:hypothetical protein